MNDYNKLLKRLEAVEVDFDPTADHDYGTQQPSKIAFVPVNLYEDLIAFFKNKTRA